MTNLQAEKIDKLNVVTLQRPEALNALDSAMIDGISDGLDRAEQDSEINALFFRGAGGKAFCAGGDIKAAREGAIAAKSGMIPMARVTDFFVREYGMNKRLFHYKKPTISFMNGITMGGGVGIANACRYKIVTDKTLWAMPEVTIGFFPDVGAAHYLARCPHHAGRYLGLTGIHVSNPADLIQCGLADFYVPADQEQDLLAALSSEGDIENALSHFHKDPGAARLNYQAIEACFAETEIEAIVEKLQKHGGQWAEETVKILHAKSPTSLKVTLRHLIKAENENFDDTISRDLDLAAKFLGQHDMSEGIRAAVVDKDRKPQWHPARLQDVDAKLLADYIN